MITLTDTGHEALAADRRVREGWLAAAIERDLSASERPVLEQATALLARLADSEPG